MSVRQDRKQEFNSGNVLLPPVPISVLSCYLNVASLDSEINKNSENNNIINWTNCNNYKLIFSILHLVILFKFNVAFLLPV